MYEKMFQYVKEYLEKNDGEESKPCNFPFHKRSDHIKRVFMWAERLAEDLPSFNKAIVLVAAIFHDVGYAASSEDFKHAENSAVICEKYLYENEYPSEFINQVVYLVRNHSNKELMNVRGTPMELVILMEADLLDNTGAMAIMWDCMMEGAQQVQTLEKTYNHILRHSLSSLNENPMVTNKAREYWKNKHDLTQEFIRHLSNDLGV